MRASVDRRRLATLRGVDVAATSALAWTLGSGLAGLAGVLAVSVVGLDATAYTVLLFASATAAVFGRLRSIPWTFAAGLALGVVQNLVAGYTDFLEEITGLRTAVPVILLFAGLVLLNRSRERVAGSAAEDAPPPDHLAGVPRWRRGLPWTVALVALMGFTFTGPEYYVGIAAQGLVLALIFCSFVVVTGAARRGSGRTAGGGGCVARGERRWEVHRLCRRGRGPARHQRAGAARRRRHHGLARVPQGAGGRAAGPRGPVRVPRPDRGGEPADLAVRPRPGVRAPATARRAPGRTGGALSGGEQQLLTLAPALVRPPRVLIADEPSLGLAPLVVQQVFELFAELRERGVALLLVEEKATEALRIADRVAFMRLGRVTWTGPRAEVVAALDTTVLLVEHDMGFVMGACDRLVLLDLGRVIASGPPDQVRDDPAVRAAYLG